MLLKARMMGLRSDNKGRIFSDEVEPNFCLAIPPEEIANLKFSDFLAYPNTIYIWNNNYPTYLIHSKSLQVISYKFPKYLLVKQV